MQFYTIKVQFNIRLILTIFNKIVKYNETEKDLIKIYSYEALKWTVILK